VFKYQLIWIRTLREEAFCVTPPPTQNCKNMGLKEKRIHAALIRAMRMRGMLEMYSVASHCYISTHAHSVDERCV